MDYLLIFNALHKGKVQFKVSLIIESNAPFNV